MPAKFKQVTVLEDETSFSPASFPQLKEKPIFPKEVAILVPRVVHAEEEKIFTSFAYSTDTVISGDSEMACKVYKSVKRKNLFSVAKQIPLAVKKMPRDMADAFDLRRERLNIDEFLVFKNATDALSIGISKNDFVLIFPDPTRVVWKAPKRNQ